jgi:hypothetical protein
VNTYKSLSRIAVRLLQSTYPCPEHLKHQFDLCVLAVGLPKLLVDFEQWCDESRSKNQYPKYPLIDYAKVVSDRLYDSSHLVADSLTARELKRRAGFLPFTRRLTMENDYSACPFHNGDSHKSFHIVQARDGSYVGTCFSECGRGNGKGFKKWDAIEFVSAFDKISSDEAIRKIEAELLGADDTVQTLRAKKIHAPMTDEGWKMWGRIVVATDVQRLAATRPDSVNPSAETLNALGFRMMAAADYLCCPYRLGDTFYTVKCRILSTKDFTQVNAVSHRGLFNIDAVTPGCDVSVTESELDVAVLYERGVTAVSVMNGGQRKIEPEVLAKLLTASRIYLIGDNDTTGVQCMDAIAKLLPPEKVFRTPVVGAKDICEAVAKHLDLPVVGITSEEQS